MRKRSSGSTIDFGRREALHVEEGILIDFEDIFLKRDREVAGAVGLLQESGIQERQKMKEIKGEPVEGWVDRKEMVVVESQAGHWQAVARRACLL